MTARGEDASGRGRGRSIPARGRGRSGTPPPPGGRGRGGGRADISATGRGRGHPGGRGGQGRGPFSPSLEPHQHSPAYRGFSPRASGVAALPNRRYTGGHSSPAVNGSAFAAGGGGSLFGTGAEVVAYEKDKGCWKVGPPPGQRFSAAWLRGLASFVEWKYEQQSQLQGRGRGMHSGAAAAPAPPPPPPPSLPEQQQREDLPVAPNLTATYVADTQEVGGLSVAGEEQAPLASPPVPVSSELVLEEAEEEPVNDAVVSQPPSPEAGPCSKAAASGRQHVATPSQLCSPASSCSSDMGWAAVLAGSVPSGEAGGSTLTAEIGGCSRQIAAALQSLNLSDAESPSPSREVPSPACSSGASCSPSTSTYQQPPALDAAELPVLHGAVEQTCLGRSQPVQLSIRLERMALTDREAEMLADWCCGPEARAIAAIRALWLFEGRLGDEGAVQVARILAAHPGMAEVHLSHNMLTLAGATALLKALPTRGPASAASGAPSSPSASCAPASRATTPARPLWMRCEWNRISLDGLMQVLEELHGSRGLLVDLPSAVRADAAPALPNLPPYLVSAAASAPAPAAAVPASRGSRNALQYLIDGCHARLPWISCQYQLPSEAAVLRAARQGWTQAPQPVPPPSPQAVAAGAKPIRAVKQPAAELGSLAAGAAGGTGGVLGPLLLFPDTSALLPMLGAGADVSIPTFFTLELLGQLARQARFGRALPPQEQIFLVVTDSVLKQLDGLKNDAAARPVIRRFLGQGLDTYGPAGCDFLTVLGAHEGEGLVVEHDAAVTGSLSADVRTKGHRADHRIVEVALFFQKEVLGGGSGPLRPGSFPVLLLSGDNGQVQTARSHGLPAARMVDLAAAQGRMEAALARQQPLTASLLRECLGIAAVQGLADKAAVRNLQLDFDRAIAALEAATQALAAAQQRLSDVAAAAAGESAAGGAAGPSQTVLESDAAGAEGSSAGATAACTAAVAERLAAVQRALAAPTAVDVGELLPVLHTQLADWSLLVRSHQDQSRLVKWAAAAL
ncbi:hypothetical protein D9Q98_006572 [Chlorella vulgaris]|uniref:PIN domain-containing protein n=1 Tax=Chlorella vulgaris TaxID=3077 RepID=A0A9D4TKF5_CHLVU|nr:hypothetical protein D9Q98_006572 [Chlorella vulgaris]